MVRVPGWCLIAAAVAGVFAAPASADVLCQKKSGAVVVRTACKRREKLVTTQPDLTGPLAAAEATIQSLQTRVQALEAVTGAFSVEDGGHTLKLKGLTAIQFAGPSVCVGPDFADSELGATHACTADTDCQAICTSGADSLLGHSCTQSTDCNSLGAADGHCTFAGSCVAPAFSVAGTDWTFSGMNVHVVNGRADEFVPRANGVGNLIVGYNKPRMNPQNPDDRTGSHNLVLGDENNYTGVGSIVGGAGNAVADRGFNFSLNSTTFDDGIVLGGVSNMAGGGDAEGNVAVGGQNNVVTDMSAVLVGGRSNHISGLATMCEECVITGGRHLSQTSGSQFSEDSHWWAGGDGSPAAHWP